MPMLNTNKLEGKVGGVWVRGTPTKRTAKGEEYRCPACASSGGDEGGQHLIVFNERGTFACAAYPGDRKHRKEIWDKVGIKTNDKWSEPVIPRKIEQKATFIGRHVMDMEKDQTQKKLKVSDRAIELAERLWAEADLALLLPDDFAVIRQYLQRRTGLEPEAKRKLSLQLAKDIQRIIHLETLPDDLTYALTADLFLEAVYLAYQRSEEDTLS